MTDKTAPTEAQMLEALQNSGYLFEQEVADRIEKLGFHVDTGWAFLDPDQDKSREIDVRGIRRVMHDGASGFSVFIELLIECKASDSPFLFLQRPKNSRELESAAPREYIFPRNKYRLPSSPVGSSPNVEPFVHFRLAPHHYYYRETVKTTQFSKIVRDKGGKSWVANHEGIYDSIILPMAKAFESRRRALTSDPPGSGSGRKFIWLLFPIVVLRDGLFALDVTTKDALPQPRGRVSFVRHLESGSVKGFYLTDFVARQHLDMYIVEEVQPYVDHLVSLWRADPKSFV